MEIKVVTASVNQGIWRSYIENRLKTQFSPLKLQKVCSQTTQTTLKRSISSES